MTLIRSLSLPLVARLTVAWGVLFAAVHFYWAAGGTALCQSGETDTAQNAYIAFIAVGRDLANVPRSDHGNSPALMG